MWQSCPRQCALDVRFMFLVLVMRLLILCTGVLLCGHVAFRDLFGLQKGRLSNVAEFSEHDIPRCINMNSHSLWSDVYIYGCIIPITRL